ncbi:MAG TPA: YfiR family protein, partial [Candidatus Synoicihabitans sp.]|nr:YfiR family protein [Candidatus Synoicihabitans sp.]
MPLLLGTLMVPSVASAQPSREYDLKAAFLYNFTSFVEWPPQALREETAPFVVGILGRDPFGPVLDQLVAGERAKNRPLVIRRFTRLDEIADCHILFVSTSEHGRLREVLRHCAGRAILTVGDRPNFADAGGMIAFGTEGDRIVLYVNLHAVEAAELVVSSKLLRVAR